MRLEQAALDLFMVGVVASLISIVLFFVLASVKSRGKGSVKLGTFGPLASLSPGAHSGHDSL
jgi:hypothetical protein